jgi:hypothetical protein
MGPKIIQENFLISEIGRPDMGPPLGFACKGIVNLPRLLNDSRIIVARKQMRLAHITLDLLGFHVDAKYSIGMLVRPFKKIVSDDFDGTE